ncbi:uncharacterized protein LOC131632013 [Vicia villosa]|uniref:uncharacterized protein LOC131632013 n=1 Tax=Vicia villosa TaxID=3911 RepID=UPI00273B020A|nr:uncharacterized protein LOC131632013 [Vicia villosa]
MEHIHNASGKKARARRMLILKENRSKHQKLSPQQILRGQTVINNPTFHTPRQPLSDLTQAFQNIITRTPVDQHSISPNVSDAGTEPRLSIHGFKDLRSCHIGSLFASTSTLKENDTFGLPSITNQHPLPLHEKNVVRAGSSSNRATLLCPPDSKTARGRPKNQYGVPNMALNLCRKFPIPTNTQETAMQTQTSNANPQPRCSTFHKSGRGRPRKKTTAPNLPMNQNTDINNQTINLQQYIPTEVCRSSEVVTPYVHGLQVPQNRGSLGADEHTPVSTPTHGPNNRKTPTCPIFTPTVNLDFNSDSDNDSDYDPFATYLSEDELLSEDKDYDAPFTIHDNAAGHSEEYYDIGSPLIECRYCKAMMWYQERMHKSSHSANPKFMMCCGNGKVELPLLREPPETLAKLLFDHDSLVSRKFQQQIRVYNMMFAFTSPGAKVDNRFNNGRGPPTLRIQGQTCHRIGSLLPPQGQKPKFAQLYIYDTENEVENRMHGLRNKEDFDPEVVSRLASMLYKFNPHAKSFQMAKQWLNNGETPNLKLWLISNRSTDGRVYNQPTVSEVAALVVGDIDTAEMRDIIMQTKGGRLQRINELHATYMAYQYPLIFPYGEDGYRPDVAHRDLLVNENSIRNRLTIREWLAFRIQTRLCEAKTLLSSRRLFQQFLVDGYTMLESEKLEWLRKNQPKLRVSKYNSLEKEGDQSQAPGISIGKRVVLPSSFVGGRRFMDQLYYDGMAICSKVGFPDLFITFTCNPNWPEIQRFLGPLHLKPQDRPDVISRVFKIKFDQLLSDLTKKGVLGKVLACELPLPIYLNI